MENIDRFEFLKIVPFGICPKCLKRGNIDLSHDSSFPLPLYKPILQRIFNRCKCSARCF